jgi:hypothetical protein
LAEALQARKQTGDSNVHSRSSSRGAHGASIALVVPSSSSTDGAAGALPASAPMHPGALHAAGMGGGNMLSSIALSSSTSSDAGLLLSVPGSVSAGASVPLTPADAARGASQSLATFTTEHSDEARGDGYLSTSSSGMRVGAGRGVIDGSQSLPSSFRQAAPLQGAGGGGGVGGMATIGELDDSELSELSMSYSRFRDRRE